MWCFSVHLGKATAVTRAALPRPTSVCGVSVFTCVSLQQSHEQRYPVLPVYVVFHVYLGKASAVTQAVLPSLPVYVVFQCLPG